MRKIPTLFRRDPANPARVVDEWHPDCLWVRDGRGIPTRKYDGTCVMLDDDGGWWARREVKRDKPRPAGFVAVEADPTTGKTVGWVPIDQSPFAKFHAEALGESQEHRAPGTYELIGPKVNGNPEHTKGHVLIPHRGAAHVNDSARDYTAIRSLVLSLASEGIEGIVYHHRDGRMAKIKARDFDAV